MRPSRHLLCSDLDGTLLGDEAALKNFCTRWEAFSRRTGAALAYVTGRTVADVLRLLVNTPDLPLPDAIAGDVGTTIHLVKEARLDKRRTTLLTSTWNRRAIEVIAATHPALFRQPEENQGEFKSSWTIDEGAPDPLPTLKEALTRAGLACHLIRSDGSLLDILPEDCGKGAAVRRLGEIFGASAEHTLVAGDTGNDTDMFHVPGVRGVLVANAHDEIRATLQSAPTETIHFANAPYAAGVIEGCRFAFGCAFDAE